MRGGRIKAVSWTMERAKRITNAWHFLDRETREPYIVGALRNIGDELFVSYLIV